MEDQEIEITPEHKLLEQLGEDIRTLRLTVKALAELTERLTVENNTLRLKVRRALGSSIHTEIIKSATDNAETVDQELDKVRG